MISKKTERGHNYYDFECPFCGGKVELRVPVAFTERGSFRCPLTVQRYVPVEDQLIPVTKPCDGEFIQMPRKYGKPAHLLWVARNDPNEEMIDDHI